LYLVTTGRHPFKGETPAETVSRITSPDPPPLPSQWVEDFPPELECVVLKSLAKSTAARYSSAQEMLVALERALPQAFELSAEIRVAEYIKGLLAEKAVQRRATIRLAKDFIERTRGESSTSSSSFSSLRGISIEQTSCTGTRPSAVAPAEPTTGQTPSTDRRLSSPLVQIEEPPRQRRWPVLIGALAILTLASVAVLRTTAPGGLLGGKSHASAAKQPELASDQLSSAGPASAVPIAATAPIPAASADRAPDAAANADEPANGTADGGLSKLQQLQRNARPKRHVKAVLAIAPSKTAPAFAGSPPPSASPFGKDSNEPAREAPARAAGTKDNPAWDPGAFGGRQ
jgi:hypothetical protein